MKNNECWVKFDREGFLKGVSLTPPTEEAEMFECCPIIGQHLQDLQVNAAEATLLIAALQRYQRELSDNPIGVFMKRQCVELIKKIGGGL